jgi:hypothetical protein
VSGIPPTDSGFSPAAGQKTACLIEKETPTRQMPNFDFMKKRVELRLFYS